MKNYLLTACMIMLAYSTMFAQAPEKMNYQGVARDNTGTILANQSIGLQIKVHSGTAGGTVVYSESHSVTTNQFGLFNVEMGEGVLLSGDFTTINWGGDVFYVETSMDPAGGTSYTSLGTQQLISVPYSLYSKSSGNASGTLNRVAKFTPNGTTLGNSMIFDNGTNVGIGYNSSANKFAVYGGDGNDNALDIVAIYRENTAASGGNGIGGSLAFWDEVSNNGFAKAARISGILESATLPNTAGALNIETLRSSGLTSAMYIDPEGNVGIGTTNPTSKVHVIQPASGTIGINTDNTYVGNNDGIGVLGRSFNNPYYGVGVAGEGGYRGVYGSADGGNSVNSVYGIYGTATGTAGTRYGVYGIASGGSTNYGVFCVGSGGYSGTWSLVSDKKFKTDLAPVTGAVDLIKQLNPVSYHLKTKEYPTMNFPEARQYGFVAQELEQVIPLLVENGSHPGASKGDEDIKLKAVNYIGMIPILTKAIQELSEQNELMKKEIEALKNK